MNVYLLSDKQARDLQALNTAVATFVPCDHGMGVCVGVSDFDGVVFSDHKSLLNSWKLKSVVCDNASQALS